MAAAAVATRGSAGVNVERGARSARRESLGLIFGFCGGCPASSVSIVVGRDASQIAPPAATAFSAMPIHVVVRRPMAGRSQKPVATAPSAAPAVFAAYSTPASAVAPAYQPTAIGNVAPMAVAGTTRSATEISTRTAPNVAGARPS